MEQRGRMVRTPTVDEILSPLADVTGWDESSQLALLESFLDDLIQKDPRIADALEKALIEQAEMEEAIVVNPDGSWRDASEEEDEEDDDEEWDEDDEEGDSEDEEPA